MKPKPDDQLSKEELLAKLAGARLDYKKLRDEKNEATAKTIRVEATEADLLFKLQSAQAAGEREAERSALLGKQAEDLKVQLAAAANDQRAIKLLGEARATVARQSLLLDEALKILGGDHPLTFAHADLYPELPNHPLIATAEEVSRIAGTQVSWRRVAENRWALLEEFIEMVDRTEGRPQTDFNWAQFLAQVRAALLERIDLQ